jgi:hypothetical protein
MYGTEYSAGVSVKLELGAGIANTVDYSAGSLLKVNVCLGFHLTCQYHLTGGDKSFTCYL